MAAFQHPVLSLEAKPVGTVDLMPEVFKLEEINQHLMWEAVRHFLAKRRAGTAKTKDKSEVSGSGRKLWKQKGTGRARVGSIRSTLWKGGGTVLHLYMAERISSTEACKNLVRNALSRFRLPYLTITPTFSICPVHGYLAGEHEFCPQCDQALLQRQQACSESCA